MLMLLRPSLHRVDELNDHYHTNYNRSRTASSFWAEVKTWNGSNVTPSADIAASGTTFTITDATLPWSLETTSRSAGLVEQWDTTRNFTINSTTTSLSVFSQ